MSTLAALYSEIEKAGLITPGRRPLPQRIKFLLSTLSGGRHYEAGKYLETRKRGRAIPGTKKPRRGKYTGVYATGVNKSESVMSDVIDEFYGVVEKAKGLIRGGSRAMERRIGRAYQKDPKGSKAGKRFSALSTLANRRKGNSFGVGYTPGKGYGSVRRTGKYK